MASEAVFDDTDSAMSLRASVALSMSVVVSDLNVDMRRSARLWEVEPTLLISR